MATNIGVQQDNSAADRAALQPVQASGWLAGFGNMFNKEMGDWFGTRRWLIQAAIWLAIINGFVAFVLWVVPIIDKQTRQQNPGAPATPDISSMGLQIFFSFVIQLGLIGVIVLVQDEIIAEKQSGTAQWVLSKPISRVSFILSKLSADLICLLLFIVAIPAVVGYAEVWLAVGARPDLSNFILALGIAAIGVLFYLTLVIMLGVLFSDRAPVLGIAFGVMFGGAFLTIFVSQVQYVLPVGLQAAAQAVAQGVPAPGYAVYEYAAGILWSIVFTAVALWRFRSQEM